MQLQKKVNKLQVEHVSEEEVDQVRTHALLRHTHVPSDTFARPSATLTAGGPLSLLTSSLFSLVAIAL